ncbi:SET domain-containing protein [Fragilariopsis cylindrus CCMP1102]|uniref:SET domain-containing protein n=1 Tax=Fragilariopsis cylindrus CCMP1102 TaxID=635003 RepID=A0A1E7ET24_9STRA|nr:SET domain-containing protein [Fragilariopsis cylindrus CCMP1102]|eukprot:OEU09168.1 SET domain-containing protein [Fragilariopsis cylindrus CCMP1102]
MTKKETTTDNSNKLWSDLVEWVNNSSSANANARNAYNIKTGDGGNSRSRSGSDDHEDNNEDNDEDVGGYVHPSLLLKQEGEGDKSSSRGIFTTTTITKGELLLRIPSYLIISGESESSSKTTTTATATATAAALKPKVSSWLKCIGEFIRLKKISTEEENKNNNSYQLPYLNSLPNYTAYETLHNWSSSTSTSTSSTTTKNNNKNEEDDLSFLTGTTLGNRVLHDRTNNITKLQYENSIKPYLKQLGLLVLSDDTNKNYELFLEASMCISTRGFHVLPTTTTTDTTTTNTDITPNTDPFYNGPFLLPVIDLLNHNPNMACTSLQRIKTTKSKSNSTNTYFTMRADRNIHQEEELYHSYGHNLTSAQLLQTFGFVPIQYTDRVLQHVEVEEEEIDNESKSKSMTDNDNNNNNNNNVTATSATTTSNHTNTNTNTTSSLFTFTPVSLKTEKHLLAATKHIKKSKTVSSYPDKLQKMIQKKSIGRSRDNNENDDNDLYWDVHDIPTRFMNDFIMIPNNEFLIQSSSSLCSNSSSEDNININNNGNNDPPPLPLLLTEDMITLLAIQFLPEEAYLEIFPSSSASAISHDTSNNSISMGSSSIRLDRSILVNDYYLGMLVCYSLLMAIQLKSKEYNDITTTTTTTSDNEVDNDNENDTSVEVEVLVLGRSLVTMCQQEKDQIQTILRSYSANSGEPQCEQQRKQRELYGRTIRLEEMINLYQFYMEIQQLMTTILQQSQSQQNLNENDDDNDNDNDEDYGSSSSSHHKKPKKAKIRL